MPSHSPTLPEQRAAVARAARAAKRRGANPDRDEQVTREKACYAELKLADAITRIVESAPPLSPEQRARLALLLRGGCD